MPLKEYVRAEWRFRPSGAGRRYRVGLTPGQDQEQSLVQRALTPAANAAPEQLLVDAASLLVHLAVLGRNAAAVCASAIIERWRRDPLLLHAVKLCIAGDLDLRLREAELRLRADRSGRDDKKRERE